jgi:arylsulfatase A-like enzyme
MDNNQRFSLAGGLTRRDVLKLGGAAGLGSLVGGRMAAAPKSPPNIVFVFPDQQRNASWPGGGDPQVKTPNLDRMAHEGAAFNHCLSTYPLCSPYRASLLTGRYPQATTITYNVGQNRGGLPTTEVTIADLLKKAGYATGYVGKWHLYPGGTEGKLVPAGPHRHGFDYWRVCHNYRKRYDTRCFDDAGKEFVLPDYAPKCQMDMTLEFIEKNARKPFCVFLSWHPPHAPYNEAPQRFVDMYRAESVKLRPNVPAQGDLRRIREAYVGYFSHVSAMDEEMGRLMKKLAGLGIADNTIVCYSSDHGDMLGSFDLWAKQKPWEESINVPFIIRWPAGIPAGRRLDHLFSTPDITPTLLGLAGIPLLPRMQGVDLSAALRGKEMAGPESAFIMARGAAVAEDAQAEGQPARRAAKKAAKKAVKNPGEWRGVRTARFTYARHHTGRTRAPWVLYDNEKDPYQLRNLVDDPAARQTQKEMDALADRWLKRLGET